MPNFAVDIGDAGVAVERNIAAAPSSLGVVGQGLSNLASNMFGVYDAGVRAAKAAEPTQTELDRSVMASFYDALEAGRGGSTAERNAAASNGIAILQRSGLGLGQNETDAIRRTLGIDINIIDPMQAAANSALAELNSNPGYIFMAEQDLRVSLKRDPTQEETVTYAFNLLAQDKANLLSITNSKNQSLAEWISTGQYAAERLITSLTDQALIGLKLEASGGDVSVDTLMQLKAAYSQLQAIITRPSNVPAEDFEATQAKLNVIGKLLTDIEQYDITKLNLQSAEMLQAIASAMIKTGDVDSTLSVIALLSGEGQAMLFQSKAGEIWNTLNNVDLNVLSAFTDTSTGSTTGQPDLTEFNSLISGKKSVSDLYNTTANSSEVIDKVFDLSIEDREALARLNNVLVVSAVSAAGLNDPQARAAWLAKAQQLNAVYATSTELFDPLTLEGVYTPDYFSKLNSLKALGDPSYEVLYAQTQEAIMKQWAVFSQTSANTLAAGVFNFDAAGNLLLEEENKMLSAQEIGFINRAAGQYYNGSILSMFSDRGRKLVSVEPVTHQLVGKLGRQFDAVYGYVNGAKSYRRLARRAGLTDNTMENILKAVRQRTTTRQPPTTEQPQQQGAGTFSGAGVTPPVQPVDNAAGTAEISQYILNPNWSANPEDVYNQIPSGNLYLDPEGNIRTKGE